MKTKHTLPLAIVSLALAANGAYAQAGDTFQHPLTVSLKISSAGKLKETVTTKKGVETTTFSQSVVSSKFSNKEILDYLVAEGVIDSAKGWSLVGVSDTVGDINSYELVQKGKDPVDVSDFIEIITSNEVTTLNAKHIAGNDNSDSDKGTSSTTGLVNLAFDFKGAILDLNGLLEGKSTYVNDTLNDIDETVAGSQSLTNLVGFATDSAATNNLNAANDAEAKAILEVAQAIIDEDSAKTAANAAKAIVDAIKIGNPLANPPIAPGTPSELLLAKETATAAAWTKATANVTAKKQLLLDAGKAADDAATAAAKPAKTFVVQGTAKLGAGKRIAANVE